MAATSGRIHDTTLDYLLLFLVALESTLCFTDGNQSPQWNNFPSTLFVSEDAPVGSVVAVLNATDADDEQLSYQVKGGPGGEVLKVTPLNSSETLVRLAKTLDREAVEEYSLLFTVSDRIHILQRWCTLYVLDINDNRPRFLILPYYTKISEGTQVGSAVYRVTAHDPDTGVWSLVSYTMKGVTDHFDINSTRGTIILMKPLHFEIKRFYQLEIVATDGGGLSSAITMEIDVVQSAVQNGMQGVRCFSCIAGKDCDQQQLSYSPAITCPLGHLCYMAAIEDPWGEYRYRRGCREIARCPGIDERCLKTEYDRYTCQRCCERGSCNRNLFHPHLLRDARTVLESRKSVAYNWQESAHSLQLSLCTICTALALTNLWSK